MGQGLGLALAASGAQVVLLSRSTKAVAPLLVLTAESWFSGISPADLVIIATPDAAITDVALELAAQEAVTQRHVVLHLSGLLDRTALTSLAPTGAGLGSFHPLQTIADPLTAPARLQGAYAGIEGDDRAVRTGQSLAHSLGMRPILLTAQAKPAYHAGAVFASNYLVTLAGVAERLAREAGIPPDDARRIYLPLVGGTAENLNAGAAQALTGPVLRGDLQTVRAHLAALNPDDRDLYCRLGLATVGLAEHAGLSPDAAASLRILFGHYR